MDEPVNEIRESTQVFVILPDETGRIYFITYSHPTERTVSWRLPSVVMRRDQTPEQAARQALITEAGISCTELRHVANSWVETRHAKPGQEVKGLTEVDRVFLATRVEGVLPSANAGTSLRPRACWMFPEEIPLHGQHSPQHLKGICRDALTKEPGVREYFGLRAEEA